MTRTCSGPLVRLLLAAGLAPASGAAQFDPAAPEPVHPHRGRVMAVGLERAADVDAVLWDWAGADEARVLVLDLEGGALGEDRMPRGARPPAADVRAAVFEGSADALHPFDRSALAQARLVWIPEAPAADVARRLSTPAWRAALSEHLARGRAIAAEGHAALVLAASYHALPTEDGDAQRVRPGLDLIPGLHLVEQAGLDPWALLAPGRPHVTLHPEGALLLRGRRLTGTGPLRVTLAAGGDRRAATRPLGGRRQVQDLLALTRAATHRATRHWPLADLPAPDVESGALVIVGGGRLGPAIGARFLELAGGPDAPCVYVPCTEAEEVEGEPGAVRMLRSFGFTDVTLVHTKDRAKADADPELLAALERARAVWFGGGRQWNLVDSWQHTEAHRLMHAVLARGGVIGGSSAGASIQADYMCRGNPLGNTDIMSEGYEEGLGFLVGCGIDQHFSQRRRQSDMESLAATYPQVLGIGIDEGTALIVQRSTGTVLGAGSVWFYDGHTAIDGVTVPVVVPSGGRYDLAARRVVE